MSVQTHLKPLIVFLLSGLVLIFDGCALPPQNQRSDNLIQPDGHAVVQDDLPLQKFNEPLGKKKKTEASTTGPLRVTPMDAVLLCLEHNRALVVQRLVPAIRQTYEDEQRSVFDPAISASMAAGRTAEDGPVDSYYNNEALTTDTVDGRIALENFFPTGTSLNLEAATQVEDVTTYPDAYYTSRLGMTVNQALLSGLGTGANLARLRQARLDTRMSQYELRGFTESLVAEVERTYWDYALARRQIEIVEESLKVVRQQLDETNALIAVGRLANAELAAVQAEVAAQEQALIEARANEETIRLQFLRLLNPKGPNLWQREIDLVHEPLLPDIPLEPVEEHIAVSRRMQPLLNQARLQIMHGDLELVKTKNGLLPLLDLFITLGTSGYADSFSRSIDRMNRESYDAQAGIRFEYPFVNRRADALYQRARLSREQAGQVMADLSQMVEIDVRTAYIGVDRTRQQIAASSVTRRYDEEKLRTETEKLRVGKSTSYLVAQAQRDLLASRIAEVRALVNYTKALIDLYLKDGSLLERRGISAPGTDPITLKAR